MGQIDLFMKDGEVVYQGQLGKMRTELSDTVNYFLKHSSGEFHMNFLVGKPITLKFEGKINCISCGKDLNKTFGQGFCYDCFVNAPEASECIVNPELCRAHLGEGRDPEWEKVNHAKPHYVYLAVSSAVKVGITRHDQIPTRWIDQGATYAIKVAKTPYRQLAGVVEVALKDVFTDKTNWRKMLTNEVLEGVDLEEEKWQLEEVLPADLAEYMVDDDEVLEIPYPVLSYPEKVKSINLLKLAEYSGVLSGIKGQYLIFEDGHVINIRNHTGFHLTIEQCE